MTMSWWAWYALGLVTGATVAAGAAAWVITDSLLDTSVGTT